MHRWSRYDVALIAVLLMVLWILHITIVFRSEAGPVLLRPLAFLSFLELAAVMSVVLLVTTLMRLCAPLQQTLIGKALNFIAYASCSVSLVFSILIYLVQSYSINLSGGYITALALESAGETRFLNKFDFAVAIVVALVVSLFAIWMVSGLRLTFTKISIFFRLLFVVIFGTLYVVNAVQAGHPGETVGLQGGQAPIVSLYKSTKALMAERAAVAEIVSEFAAKENAFSNYPLQKTFVYQSDFPYPRNPSDSFPNIIVIFSEGLSARLIGLYGGPPGLMPSLSMFGRGSTVVNEYYGHTAATFRGLQGQLTSGFPLIGGALEGGGGVGARWECEIFEVEEVQFVAINFGVARVYVSFFLATQ